MNCREFHGSTYGHDNCPCCPRCGIDLVHESPNGVDCLCTREFEDRAQREYDQAYYDDYCEEMRVARDKEISDYIIKSFTTV